MQEDAVNLQFPDVMFKRAKNGKTKIEVAIKTKNNTKSKIEPELIKKEHPELKDLTKSVSANRYIGGLQELLRETNAQLLKLNPNKSVIKNSNLGKA